MAWLNYFRIALLSFIFLSLPQFDDATLSKSGSKAKKPPPATKKTVVPDDSPLEFKFQYSDILKTYDQVDYKEERKFSNPTLGYVTPWNNHGYNIAKLLAHKFTHISPVWFQLKPDPEPDSRGCNIAGTHDLDQSWIKDVRSNNSDVKIVPRFLFEAWTPEQLRHFMAYSSEQEKCIADVVKFCLRNKFDGAVFELWTSVMSFTQGQSAQELVDLLVLFGETFAKNSLLIILPVTPPLNENNQVSGMFTPQHFHALLPYIDFFNIMLYDFKSAKGPGPVAPVDWVRKCLQQLTFDDPVLSGKILMGLNFYGYMYQMKIGRVEPILGSKFIEILKTTKPQLQWNKAAAEHFVVATDQVVFYPTLVSIETRLKLAEEMKVGIGIWELGQGLDYFYNLL